MRKIASVQKIDAIYPIEGADRIVQYLVNGWRVVDGKDKYKVGDLVVFAEVDAWVPSTIASFLTKPGRSPKEYLGVSGERLKTAKFKGALSQGLIISIETATEFYNYDAYDEGQEHSEMFFEGADMSGPLGIVKWERPEEFTPANANANAKGNFPSWIPKTDQTRVQNLYKTFDGAFKDEDIFYVEEKAEGSSMTVYIDIEGNFGVCSRNLDLKEDEGNTFWAVANKGNLKDAITKLLSHGFFKAIAIQGELIGPGIQDNIYGLQEHEFLAFDMYGVDASGQGSYCPPEVMRSFMDAFGVKMVPDLGTITGYQLKQLSLDGILQDAEIPTEIGSSKHLAEGKVYKLSREDEAVVRFTFKAVSNAYLLKRGY